MFGEKQVDNFSANAVLPIYITLLAVFYFSYFFFIAGWLPDKYAIIVHSTIQAFIALVLILRYHPFRSDYVLLKSDRYIIFGSAIFLLLNLGVFRFVIPAKLQQPLHSDGGGSWNLNAKIF